MVELGIGLMAVENYEEALAVLETVTKFGRSTKDMSSGFARK